MRYDVFQPSLNLDNLGDCPIVLIGIFDLQVATRDLLTQYLIAGFVFRELN